MKKLLLLSLMLSCSLTTNALATEYNVKDIDCKNDSTGILFCYDKQNNPITGIVTGYYENGNLQMEVQFKNGKPEGVDKEYYESGNLRMEQQYKNGKKNGVTKAYYESGNLKGEAQFKNDKIEGIVKDYYANGNLKMEVQFKNDVPVSGYIYNNYGNKMEMTNAHLHNLGNELKYSK